VTADGTRTLATIAFQPRIEAVVRGDAAASCIASLLEAGAPSPVKWDSSFVKDYVLTAQNQRATTLRSVLSSQIIVITDAMELPRTYDVAHAEDGWQNPTVSWLALNRATTSTPEHDQLRQAVRTLTIQHILECSGVGRIDELVRSAAHDGRIGPWLAVDPPLSNRVITRTVGGSVRSAVRLASQGTSLAIQEMDRDDDFAFERATDAALLRFSDGVHPYEATQRLARIVDAGIVFDEGEEKTTAAVSQLRTCAAGVVSGLRADLTSEPIATRGFVLTGNDADHPNLQLADVAAGWASLMLQQHGLLGLARGFAEVVYNGKRLDEAYAERLDRERRQHQVMLTGVRIPFRAR
jgi:hypothetical protein